jgi:hypothetical protein
VSYRDGLPSPYRPIIIPDIRVHIENWRHFKEVTQTWPMLSIVAYVVNFVAVIGGFGLMALYGSHHVGSRSFWWWPLALIAFPFMWRRFVERIAWNYELRQAGISSNHEVWDVTQFPQPEDRRGSIRSEARTN